MARGNPQLKEIEDTIGTLSFIKSIQGIGYVDKEDSFGNNKPYVSGKITISFNELDNDLDFIFYICPTYPFKENESESIKFINTDLIEYNHVMGDGSICIHTSHHINYLKKLLIDFNSLKNWIIKYYIENITDTHYEHIIVNENHINDNYYSYLFTNVNKDFKKNDYGDVKISFLSNGVYRDKQIINNIIQSFIISKNEESKCNWSNYYKKYKINSAGFYYFVGNAPVNNKRFIFTNWKEFVPHVSKEFLNFLYRVQKKIVKKHKGEVVPIFFGYKTIETKIHWQVAMLGIGGFPLKGVPETINGNKTGNWNSKLIDREIIWSLTSNSSYKYLFGRGAFCSKITEAKTLIIGIGAIGSIVAKTLTRCGSKNISVVDFDIKEPENICRSEYFFNTGITNKTTELSNVLPAISPFVEVKELPNDFFENIIKSYSTDKFALDAFSKLLNQYDIIFDCSTDNDLMFILNKLNLKNELINMSITNHAKELICAFHPNIYNFVNTQFTKVLCNDTTDLYEPTGCWSPTFRASYNDIDLLVQMALKHINTKFEKNIHKNNFVITSDSIDKKACVVEY